MVELHSLAVLCYDMLGNAILLGNSKPAFQVNFSQGNEHICVHGTIQLVWKYAWP